MNPLDIHDEWLSLIEVSGPFLATPVLKRVFSTGLPAVEPRIRQYLRQAYDEWSEARDNDDPRFTELHRAWIHEVLARGLDYDESDSGELLLRGERIPSEQRVTLPEHGVTLEPDYVLVSGGKSLLLVQVYSAGTDLQAALKLDGWSASPAERMERLCRASGCRLGLVTDGERWMLVDAPVGAVSTFASWYARLWGQERLTLQAFLTLLGIRRFFGPDDETLPSMLDESLQHQEEVTDALGEQVRRAVEVLIQALGKEDRERSGALLKGVQPTELYEAGLTIMMRLVFLLSAEERGLLLMGEEAYESNYAISTLRMQLRQETEEVLERRHDAWSRLLATFRAVYGGIEHEALRLPALGGSLFDPDRFPFLEGRSKGSDWKIDSARPLPIDNRTVLLLLEAIQQYEGRTLSYRALDVEQIGYVYEGLLERTVGRAERVTVELAGGKGAKKTIYALEELEALHQRGCYVLAKALSGADALKRSEGAIRKDLERSVDAAQSNRLLTACAGDEGLRDRALPFLNLLRTDPWGYPLIYPQGAFIVTTGSDRRETGTHYTPKSLTETIVTETLIPVTYLGPAEGAPREQWRLKSPKELLDLKVCDPAMGSGAFLVQVCRWLADRLVEAWSQVEALGETLCVDGEVLDAEAAKEPLPRDSEVRSVIARRLIAERCLYGVDLNPLAVELAKLSIWLVTLAKDRPVGFLDHNLRCGDSLLGIHKLEQLTQLSMAPTGKGQQRLFGQNIERAVREAVELRLRLREMPIRDIHDVEAMARIDTQARRRLHISEKIADAFIGEMLNPSSRAALEAIAIEAGQAIDGSQDAYSAIRRRASITLSAGAPFGVSARRPVHWPLEFPEVFIKSNPGFDAVVGNPPYRGGSRITIDSGVSYRDFIVRDLTDNFVGRVDLCVYFLRQVARLSSREACFGLVLTNSVAQGHNRDAGLAALVKNGRSIFRAVRDLPWIGAANVVVSLVWVANKKWCGNKYLNDKIVANISSSLLEEKDLEVCESRWDPKHLLANKNLCFRGVEIRGDGFILSREQAERIIKNNPSCKDVIRPFLTGTELNSNWPKTRESFVISFGDRSHEEARLYAECWDIVVEKVKPGRDAITKQIHEECFWKFWDKRTKQFEEVSGCSEYLVKARDSTEWAFAYVSMESVVSSKIIVFKDVSLWRFACLQSGVHRVWCENGASTIGRAVTYNPTIGLGFFPFPDKSVGLDFFARGYLEVRGDSMSSLNVGMNDLYRLTHSSSASGEEVEAFRQQIVKLDKAVVAEYGWEDIDLDHGFHEVPYLPERNCIRFTISETARVELLRRLTDLNRLRYEQEVACGLYDGSAKRAKAKTQRDVSMACTTPAQTGFNFNAESMVTASGVAPTTKILEFLRSNQGWHARSDILAATGVSGGQWNSAITDLFTSNKVERQGERRGARYRVRREGRDE
ncbi:Eco57I restriction-modification methylase domain-containing protein [Pseudomonas paraeruginosa]